MNSMLVKCSALTLALGCGVVFAQAPAAAPPAAAPPAAAPTTSAPPAGTGNVGLNPPIQQGAADSHDANGNAIAQPNSSQVTNSGQGGGVSSSGAPASGSSRITPFAMLDIDKAGYIKMDQARGDAWLAQHFVQCDTNHNEEVTESEYETCTSR